MVSEFLVFFLWFFEDFVSTTVSQLSPKKTSPRVFQYQDYIAPSGFFPATHCKIHILEGKSKQVNKYSEWDPHVLSFAFIKNVTEVGLDFDGNHNIDIDTWKDPSIRQSKFESRSLCSSPNWSIYRQRIEQGGGIYVKDWGRESR